MLKLDIFPEEIQASFTQSVSSAPSARLHIVDVHTLGQFPAEFKVDVYQPQRVQRRGRVIVGREQRRDLLAMALGARAPVVGDFFYAGAGS